MTPDDLFPHGEIAIAIMLFFACLWIVAYVHMRK
jgi:hypothetical protein